MKLLSYYLLVFVLMISCDDFLEEQPDDRIELNSLDKISELSGASYPYASHAFTDWYTDLASTQIPGQIWIRNYDDDYYRWQDTDHVWQDSPTYFWNSAYAGIASSNHALEALENFEDSDLKNAIKSEALLWRAYHHFMLVNVFGKHFNESTASNDLGVPYVVKPEKVFVTQYQRNTVEEVYTLIERDLTEALPHINDEFFEGTTKFRFNQKAALAFASRFYLFKQDYENCIKYGLELIESDPSLYIRNLESVYDVISEYNTLREAYGKPSIEANILMSETFSWFQRSSYGYRLNRNELNALYRGPINPNSSLGDSRVNEAGVWSLANGGADLPRFNEYFFKETLSSETGLGYKLALLITGEEVVLNVAEAYLGQGNIDKSIEYLNYLAEKRYYGNVYSDNLETLKLYYNQPTDELALLSTLLDERNKEFFMYGMRWFDIKRHHIPVVHEFYDFNSQQLVDTFILPADDPRRQIQIPEAAISAGMTPNPR